jgi:hypothetical protein
MWMSRLPTAAWRSQVTANGSVVPPSLATSALVCGPVKSVEIRNSSATKLSPEERRLDTRPTMLVAPAVPAVYTRAIRVLIVSSATSGSLAGDVVLNAP